MAKKLEPIEWHEQKWRIGDLHEWEDNPRELTEEDAAQITASLKKFNLAEPLVINQDGQIIGGHQRKRLLLAMGKTEDDFVDVRVPNRMLTEAECRELAIRLNKNTGRWDFDRLANSFDLDDLRSWGFKDYQLGIPGASGITAEDIKEMWEGMPAYASEDQAPFKDVLVHFRSQSDVEAFARLVGQTITDKTKYIWYPYKAPADLKSLVSYEQS